MRQSKKAERSMAILMEMLSKSGVEQEQIQEMQETAPTGHEAISRQGEAVLLFLESPAKYTAKLCKRCEEPFGTNYRSVGYCSDTCRAKAISEQLGVKWNYFKTEEERWGGEPPLIIPPLAFRKIQEYIQFFASVQDTQIPLENLPELVPLTNPPVLPTQEVVQTESQFSIEAHTNTPQSLPELFLEQEIEEEFSFDF